MASTFFRLLVVLLGISHLLCSNAIPVTRTRSLMQVSHVRLENFNMASMEEESVHGRMDVEVLDYPGSGANNRHTPRGQAGRCYDC